MAQGRKSATVNAISYGFDSHEEMKYVIFSFPFSGNEARRGVEFRHKTRDIFRTEILRKVGNGMWEVY